jgi:DNA-binding transcriptional regulator YiaG
MIADSLGGAPFYVFRHVVAACFTRAPQRSPVPSGPLGARITQSFISNLFMPNIATVLKEEIARIARKELRRETETLHKAVARYRSDIAALKRRLAAAESVLKKGARSARAATTPGEESSDEGLRFRAAGLASHRKRLGLSAEAFGKLVGVSGQSIYAWESGKTRPRKSQMAAIAAVRSIGRREAAARLAR